MVQGPLPLSVAIVVKNGAATLGRTLEAVRPIAAEIVALDSGSTDGTLEMLARAGARVVHTQWLGHVRTKQKALEAAVQPWILSLDADESPEPELVESIRRAVASDDPLIGGYTLNRKIYYCGRPLNYAWQPERRLRLVRRGRAAWGGIDPHDKLDLLPGVGGTGRLEGDLRHDSFVTFDEQFRKQCHYARLMAAEIVQRQKASGQSVGIGTYWRLLTSPSMAFAKQMVLKRAFLDGWPGWLAAASTAQQALMKHALIIELSGRIEPHQEQGPPSGGPRDAKQE